jgi:PilZ domain-containing protein
MTTDYSEKRNFFRMNLECIAEYTINGSGNQKSGKVSDLSGDGISIIADQSVKPGTEVRVCIQPENKVTPALEIVMEVLRCEEQNTDSYLLAGNITKR